MTNFDNIISVSNLTKQYEIGAKPISKLLKALFRFKITNKNRCNQELLALNEVSFELRRGESLGILGLNGSGKSTLLQIITKTLQQTSGEIKVKGKVAALLELGSGFNPDFTGRENAILSGTLLGSSRKEITRKIPDIQEFAEIGEFFDMPIRTYSSGMQMRLAFSVATSIQPDILIVDEALSVGDAFFQAKCFERISKFKKNGMSLILVTHDINEIPKHCDLALLLVKGKVYAIGEPKRITNIYLDSLHSNNKKKLASSPTDQSKLSINPLMERFHERPFYRKEEYRWGNKKAKILDYEIKNEKEVLFPKEIVSDDKITITFSVFFHYELTNVIPGLLIKSIEGDFLYGTNSNQIEGRNEIIRVKKNEIRKFSFTFKPYLNSGNFLISVGISEKLSSELEPLDRRYDSILLKIRCSNELWGIVDLRARFHQKIVK